MSLKIDEIFNKIQTENIKYIESEILLYMLCQTSTSSEAFFIIEKLECLGIILSNDNKVNYLYFVEEFDEAKRVLKSFKKIGKKDRNETYHLLLETTDTQEEANQVFEDMDSQGIKHTIGDYIQLIEKQNTYKDARKIFKNNLLSDEHVKKDIYNNFSHNAPLREIFSILYHKAKTEYELQEVKDELEILNMSTNLNDYDSFSVKSSIRRAYRARTQLLEDGNFLSLEDEVNTFLESSDKMQKKIKSKNGNYTSNKQERTVNVYDRNKGISNGIKSLYNNYCQICGRPLDTGKGFYSEVHHIQPLHLNGPDIAENMICLCPNHHTLFDRGSITINLEDKTVTHVNGTKEQLKLLKHDISMKFISYHNSNIFNKIHDSKKLSFEIQKSSIDYGAKVIAINIRNKEELSITIEKNKHKGFLSFWQYKFVNHKIGDLINVEGEVYLIINVINNI